MNKILTDAEGDALRKRWRETVEELARWTVEDVVKYAIVSVETANSSWKKWADNWVSGTDRTVDSAKHIHKREANGSIFGIDLENKERPAGHAACLAANAAVNYACSIDPKYWNESDPEWLKGGKGFAVCARRDAMDSLMRSMEDSARR